MELKNSKIFNKEIMQAVSAFCESEGIKNIDHFMYLCFKQGFDIKRYGLLGKTLNDGEKDLKIGGEQEKWVEKEIIVEKRVEIPVEVIKEVEKISDKTTEDELGEIITNLKDEMSKKNKDLDELRQNLNILKENDKTKLLQETLQNLRTELQQKNEQIKELEKINRALLNGNQNQAYLLKGSNLKDRI